MSLPKFPVIAAVAFAIFSLGSFNSVFAQVEASQAVVAQPKYGIEGQRAPAWNTSTWHQLPDGKESLDVTDFQGKVVYLYFFQSWCPGCHSSGFPTLKKVSDAFVDDTSVAFVAIQTTFEGHSVNTAKKLKPVANRHGLKIPFGQSAEKSGTPDIMKKYRTGGTPWVVVINRQGQVVFNGFHVDADKAIKGIRQLAQQ